MTAFILASLALPGSELLDDRPNILEVLIFSAIFMTFPAVGLTVAWKRPHHPIGWLFLVVGVATTMTIFAGEYAGRTALLGADLPAADIVAWLGGWSFFFAAGIALPLAIILFPTGRLPGKRWRPIVWVGSLAAAVTVVAIAIDPRPLTGYDGRFANPFAVGGPVGEVVVQIVGPSAISLLVMTLLAAAALIARFRGSRGIERQQLKFLLYAVFIFVVGVLGERTFAAFGLAAVAVGIGIAILRHRLFDIDVVIRRTLVYGALVAVLGAVYVALVLGLQAVLSELTGGGTLPVALSTLAIAALFGPVRRRVREVVDRRFYRSRYDHQRMVESFGSRLRDEVDLEAVGRTLVDVADRAVRPASASLWVRGRTQ